MNDIGLCLSVSPYFMMYYNLVYYLFCFNFALPKNFSPEATASVPTPRHLFQASTGLLEISRSQVFTESVILKLYTHSLLNAIGRTPMTKAKYLKAVIITEKLVQIKYRIKILKV